MLIACAGPRPVVVISYDPAICCMLNLKQPRHGRHCSTGGRSTRRSALTPLPCGSVSRRFPVLFITEAGAVPVTPEAGDMDVDYSDERWARFFFWSVSAPRASQGVLPQMRYA